MRNFSDLMKSEEPTSLHSSFSDFLRRPWKLLPVGHAAARFEKWVEILTRSEVDVDKMWIWMLSDDQRMWKAYLVLTQL